MRILGWVLFAATCVVFALQGLFLAASTLPMTSYEVLVNHVFPLLGIGAIVGAGVGALIVSRYPRNLIGWLFLVGQLGNVIGLAADAFGILVAQEIVHSTVAGQIARYLSGVFGTVFTVTVMSVIFMIAPDGRPLSRRWRLAIGVPVAAQALWWAGIVTGPAGVNLPGAAVEQGFRETLAEVLILAGFFATLLSISLGAVALVLRMRRSTGQQRLQLRWISTGAAVLAVTFVLFALSDLLPQGTPWILPEATCLAYIFFSVSVGVAIFRYRLYDIDVILSRAIVLGVLAAFVTVGYIVVVVAIGAALMAAGAPGSTLYWPSLVATALVAVAFQPLRRHVLRLADQLVYGNRAAPYEALASLSRQLADSPSPDALPARVAEATGRAVGAAGLTVRLGEPREPSLVRSAAWSDTGSAPESMRVGVPTLVLPVQDMGEQVGSIEVTLPPGRALRTFERNLLDDVAAQAGVAFRNALLQAELSARVEQSDAQSVELAASRRRLLGVEDEARVQLADAIQRSVVPHLAAVDTELTAGPATDQYLPQQLEPIVGETERALEELRTVCRGVFPALLERRGLTPALSAQLDLTHPHSLLEIDDTADQRLNRAVEAAGYLFCIEVAPTDRSSLIKLRVYDDQLVAAVIGNSDWAKDIDRSDGMTILAAWQHSRDRVAALDGAVTVQLNESGMTVTAVIPLDPQSDHGPAMTAHSPASRPGPTSRGKQDRVAEQELGANGVAVPGVRVVPGADR